MPVSLVQRGPFSYDEYTNISSSDASTRTFTLDKAKFDSTIGEVLEVFVDGVKLVGDGTFVTGGSNPAAGASAHEFSVNSANTQVTIVSDSDLASATDSAVATVSAGNDILIRRVSNRSAKKVDFAPGSVIREADLDNANTQVFHVAQEAIDTALQGMVLDAGTWNAESGGVNRTIKNAATPTSSDPSHYVATKGYVDGQNTTATVASIENQVVTVAGISTDVTSVAGAVKETIAYTLTESGSKFFINGGEFSSATTNPVLNLQRGSTYTFDYSSSTISSGSHVLGFSTADTNTNNSGAVAYTTGITDNTTDKIITFVVPSSAPDTLYYYCTAHNAMGNTINVAEDSIEVVADNIVNVNKVAAVDEDVTKVADIDGNITTVAGIGTNGADVTTVAGKADEIGRIGVDTHTNTSTGTLVRLASDTTHTDTSTGTLKLLGTSANVTAMSNLGTSANVTNMSNLNDTGVVDDLATLGSGKDGKAFGETDYDSGTNTNISQINTVATNISNVNNFANTYLGAVDGGTDHSSAPTTNRTEGDLYYNTNSSKKGLFVYNGSSWESIETEVGGNTVTSTSGNNLTLTTPSDSNNVVINSTTGTSGNTIVLPKVRASTNNYVLAMSDKTTGETAWQATTIAPTITSVSGLLNVDSDSTLTIVGSDFNASTSVKLFSAATGGTDIATATVDTSRVPTKLEATFGASALTTAGAGQQCFVELSNSGISTRHQTGITINVDPTATFSGGSGVNYSESTHLGTYGYQVDGGGQDSNTKLLLNFDRGGGTDIEDSSNTDGDGHKITATNAAIKASPFGDGKSAFYFKGGSSSDKSILEVGSSPALGTSVYSLDFWIYPTSTQNGTAWDGGLLVFDLRGDGSQDTAPALHMHNSNWQLKLINGHTTNDIFSASADTALVPDRWNHVAFVREGTSTSQCHLYIDGSLKTTFTDSTDWTATGSDWIGGNYNGDHAFTGYIDEWRLVIGEAVFTSDFTPSKYRYGTTVATHEVGTASNMKVLIHSDQTYDSSDSNHAVIAKGNSHMTTTNGRANWNNSSWSFDGTDDYLLTPQSSNFDFGTDDFCIEFWWRGDFGGNDIFWSFGTSGDAGSWRMYQEADNKIRVTMGSDGTRQFDTDSSTVWEGDSSWHHFAMTKTGTTLKLYIDGVEETTINGSFTSTPSSSVNLESLDLAIGCDTNGAYDLAGNIVDFRIVKGTTVYTGAFSAPTGSLTTTGGTYPNSNNRTDPTATQTVLLINGDGAKFTDSATSDHTITPTGAYHSQGHGGIKPAMTWPTSLKKTGSAGCHFDGDGDYLDLGNASNLETALFSSTPTTLTFSVDYWVYYKNVGSDITILGTNQSGGYNFGLGIRSDKHLGFSGTSAFGEGTSNSTATTVVNNTWYHVLHVVTWKHAYTDASDKPKSYNYLDGVYKGYSEATYSNPGGAHNNRTQYAPDDGKFTIGGQIEHDSTTLARDFNGYLANFRVKIEDVRLNASDPLYTGDTSTPGTNTSSNNFSAGLPTKIYGSYATKIIDKITFTGDTSADLADDEDIEFSEVTNTNQPAQKQDFSDIGLSITNLTGPDKNKATLTGTLNFADSTSVPKLAMKVQVRKTLGNSAGSSGQNTITFSSGTTTVGLSKDMIVTGTGINASETKITSVDSSTQISVDNNHASTVSGDLIFLDPDRVSHMNGNDTYSTGDTALTIATGPGSSPVFNARRYMGNSVGLREINGLGFQPDLVWIKNREDDNWNQLNDSVRGPNKAIFSNSGNQEDPGGQYLSEFLSDGFRLGKSGTGNSNVEDGINADNEGIIAWAWKAGGAPSGTLAGSGATASLTNGVGNGTIHNSATGVSNATSITQSVDQNSGFSITKFTGSTSGVTFPHNLGGAPDFFIIKHLGTTSGWPTYHKDLSSINYYLSLNGNADEDEMSAGTGFVSAGTTNIQLGTDWAFGGAAANFICYAWKAVVGVSAFGSYDGNNTERTITFPNIGGVANEFAPSFVMIKTYDGSDNSWWIYDNARVPSGTRNNSNQLRADASHSESTNSTSSLGVTLKTDNGFTIHSSHGGVNDAANKYIYIAFA